MFGCAWNIAQIGVEGISNEGKTTSEDKSQFQSQTACLFCYPVRSSHRFSLDNFAAQLLRCFARTLNCQFPTGLAPYAILSRDQLAKLDRQGECAFEITSSGGFTEAHWNAHRSVNTWIRIECALQVVCEQALALHLRSTRMWHKCDLSTIWLVTSDPRSLPRNLQIAPRPPY